MEGFVVGIFIPKEQSKRFLKGKNEDREGWGIKRKGTAGQLQKSIGQASLHFFDLNARVLYDIG